MCPSVRACLYVCVCVCDAYVCTLPNVGKLRVHIWGAHCLLGWLQVLLQIAQFLPHLRELFAFACVCVCVCVNVVNVWCVWVASCVTGTLICVLAFCVCRDAQEAGKRAALQANRIFFAREFFTEYAVGLMQVCNYVRVFVRED